MTTTAPSDIDDTTIDYADYADYGGANGGVCSLEEVRDVAKVLLPTMYAIIFVLGLLGNVLVLFVYAYRRRLGTVMDIFLFNLALADILFLLTLPFYITAAIKGWVFGETLCKFIKCTYNLAIVCVMFLMTFIAIDRYVMVGRICGRVKNVLLAKCVNRQHSGCVFFMIWIAALLMAAPNVFLYQVQESVANLTLCTAVYDDLGMTGKVLHQIFVIVTTFALPLLVIVVCYIFVIKWLLQLPKSVSVDIGAAVKTLILVMLCFVITQGPHAMIKVYQIFGGAAYDSDCGAMKRMFHALQLVETFAMFHTVMNPVIYTVTCQSFRDQILRLKDYLCCGRQPVPDVELSDTQVYT